MTTFEIVKIDKTLYTLKQKNGFKTLKLMFEFFNVATPKEGDLLGIGEKLLDKLYEGFAQPYSFELYMEYNDKKILPLENEEFAVLYNGNKNYIMKRIYG